MPVSDIKLVASKIAKKKEVDDQVLESIGDFMFGQVYENMFNFEDLVLSLPGFCSFFYTKKRLEQLRIRLEDKLKGVFETLPNQKIKMSYLSTLPEQETKELLAKVNKLLVRYDEYITEKRTMKQKQIEYEKSINSSKGDN